MTAISELPVAFSAQRRFTPRLGGAASLQAQAQYRSIFHWRPILNGYASYFPRGFAERMALGERLPDAHALAELRRQTGLTQILVHTYLLPAARLHPWLAAAEQKAGPLRLVARDGGSLLFSVD